MHAFCRITASLALLLCVVACGSKQISKSRETVEEATPEVLVAELTEGSTCEVLADFGIVEPRAVEALPIRVINTTEEPIVLLDYTTTCRCTTLDMQRTPIEAGGECEVMLTFDSRGEWGGVGNFLDITTSNPECGFVIWMAATIQ